MARLEFAAEVADDVDRIFDHVPALAVADRNDRVQAIIQAIEALSTNPLIARLLPEGKRELVIGRKSREHLALYRTIGELDIVFVLALRSQTEAGSVER